MSNEAPGPVGKRHPDRLRYQELYEIIQGMVAYASSKRKLGEVLSTPLARRYELLANLEGRKYVEAWTKQYRLEIRWISSCPPTESYTQQEIERLVEKAEALLNMLNAR